LGYLSHEYVYVTTRFGSSVEYHLGSFRCVGSIGPPLTFNPQLFPQRLVNVSQDWAKHLNLLISPLNTTVFGFLMAAVPDKPNPPDYPPLALASMMTNGLVRSGFTSQLQGNLKAGPGGSIWERYPDGNYWIGRKGDVFTADPEEGKDWLKFEVESTAERYAYNIRGVPAKVAIAIVTVYCAFALWLLSYSGFSGMTSTDWDFIAEVTALAMNSTPTEHLRNTCAGIMGMHIYRLPVRILAATDKRGEDHLELVFCNVDEKTTERRSIKLNKKYGTMARR